MSNNPSSRNYKLLLYPDNLSHVSALEIIKSTYDKYVYILHDRDVKEGGEDDKPHWHVFLILPTEKHLEQLAAFLGIESRFCQVNFGSRVPALRYLIHKDHPSKFQYSEDDVIGTVKGLSAFQSAINVGKSVDESEQALVILEYIYSIDYFSLTVANVTRFCIDNGLYSTFRRGFCLYSKIITDRYFQLQKMGKYK